MKKKSLVLVMLAVMLTGSALTVRAEEKEHQVVTQDGNGNEFKVHFNGKQIDRTFKDEDISTAIAALQPGDDVEIQIKVENNDKRKTTWYLKNDIIASLEKSTNDARGGVYSYNLTYIPGSGSQEPFVLYDSENVGGENKNTQTPGLQEVMSDMTEEDWLYMDQLNSKGNGTISLKVGLDGETQGNSYQNTAAKLELNFAVERAAATPSGGGSSSHRNPGDPGSSTPAPAPVPASAVYSPGAVQTGDPSNMLLWSAAALASGLVLTVFIVCFYKKKKEE